MDQAQGADTTRNIDHQADITGNSPVFASQPKVDDSKIKVMAHRQDRQDGKNTVGPRIVVIGAGSHFFGRPVIWNMVTSPVLSNGTLVLVDTDPEVLETMDALAKRAVEATGVATNIEASTNRRDVLADADFVVLTFSRNNAHYRGIDCDISFKHGIRMCSGDTIGPGGIFRALREIPVAIDVANDVAELAPHAWLINFVNPATVLGMALDRYAGDVKSFSICDGPHEPYNRLRFLKGVGILPDEAAAIPSWMERRLRLEIVGVNHFTWLTEFSYDGQDYLPVWREHVSRRAADERRDTTSASSGEGGSDNNAAAKARYNASYALALMEVYGAYPDRVSHTKEYVSFFQGYGAAPVDPEAIKVFDAKTRQLEMDARRRENAEYASGERPIAQFLSDGKADHATDIIESMWGNLGKRFYINTRNEGAVPNMADDAILELRCDLDMGGINPRPSVPIPTGLRGLTQQVIDTHELTAAAGATYDRDVLLRALATDPIINNLSDARAVMADLFEAERDILRPQWYA